MTVDVNALRAAIPHTQPPFSLKKLGHVVIKVTDLQRSLAFYAGVLGFKVSDIIGEGRMPGGMIFLRCNPDHHGIALVGGAPGSAEQRELHHIAFEAGSLDDVFRARKHLCEQGVTIVFEGRYYQIAPTAKSSVTLIHHPHLWFWAVDHPPLDIWPPILGAFSL